jgi:hypothetical protein
MDSKLILGIIGALLGALGYIFYYVKMFSRGGTKPCIFTWVPIAIMTSFGLFAQIKTGALWGALVLGITAFNCIACAIIALLYFSKTQKSEWTDWVCFTLALIAIILWKMTNGLVLPIIIVCIADVISFIPTYKRGWKNPFGESLPMWALNCIKFIFGILAIQEYRITTLLLPLTIASINGTFALIIIIRRKYIKKRTAVQ